MGEQSQVPEKAFYKIGEVCRYTDTQPYVLRFWESEFPQLAPHKNRSGQRIYRREDVDLILRIKKLLYEEEYTIAGARQQLDEERSREGGVRAAPRATAPRGERSGAAGPPPVDAARGSTPGEADPASYRASYEEAKAEIETLRRRITEVESELDRARTEARTLRERSLRVAADLESLLSARPDRRGRSRTARHRDNNPDHA